MNVEEKERLIKKDIASIENKVRHVFNQGYEMGLKESRSKKPNTCGDAISRNDVIDTLNNMDRYVADELTLCSTGKKFEGTEVFVVDDVYEEIAENLPSVNPHPIECGDAISRQAVLDATVNKNSIWNMITNSRGENLEEIISQLPSVSPQQRTGRWIGTAEEELMKKIEKEEKWLIHALNDQTEATPSYSVDIAFDAVKHYAKDYINSQQKEVEE